MLQSGSLRHATLRQVSLSYGWEEGEIETSEQEYLNCTYTFRYFHSGVFICVCVCVCILRAWARAGGEGTLNIKKVTLLLGQI